MAGAAPVAVDDNSPGHTRFSLCHGSRHPARPRRKEIAA